MLGPRGDRIGQVFSVSGACSPKSEAYIVVERKFLGLRIGYLYPPVSAIAAVRDGKVILSVSPTRTPRKAWERRV